MFAKENYFKDEMIHIISKLFDVLFESAIKTASSSVPLNIFTNPGRLHSTLKSMAKMKTKYIDLANLAPGLSRLFEDCGS